MSTEPTAVPLKESKVASAEGAHTRPMRRSFLSSTPGIRSSVQLTPEERAAHLKKLEEREAARARAAPPPRLPPADLDEPARRRVGGAFDLDYEDDAPPPRARPRGQGVGISRTNPLEGHQVLQRGPSIHQVTEQLAGAYQVRHEPNPPEKPSMAKQRCSTPGCGREVRTDQSGEKHEKCRKCRTGKPAAAPPKSRPLTWAERHRQRKGSVDLDQVREEVEARVKPARGLKVTASRKSEAPARAQVVPTREPGGTSGAMAHVEQLLEQKRQEFTAKVIELTRLLADANEEVRKIDRAIDAITGLD